MMVTFFQSNLNAENKEKVSLGEWMLRIMGFYTHWDFHWTHVYPTPPASFNGSLPNFVGTDQYSAVPIIMDPLNWTIPNNVTKAADKMQHILDAFFAAANSVWADCVCPCHKKKTSQAQKYAEGSMCFLDRKHSFLQSMFAAVAACKRMHELDF